MNLQDFIERFRDRVIQLVALDANPLYRPGVDRKEIYQLIKQILRRPIASQIDAIGGVVKALKSRDSAILVGEMGLGKTYISFLRRLTIHLPAWVFLLIWFFLQISMGLKPQTSNVAFWAHVGGFLAGAVVAIAVHHYISDVHYPPKLHR